jgi:hypothetical protein
MKSPAARQTIWKRFREEEQSSSQSRWGLLALVAWIAAQSLWTVF